MLRAVRGPRGSPGPGHGPRRERRGELRRLPAPGLRAANSRRLRQLRGRAVTRIGLHHQHDWLREQQCLPDLLLAEVPGENTLREEEHEGAAGLHALHHPGLGLVRLVLSQAKYASVVFSCELVVPAAASPQAAEQERRSCPHGLSVAGKGPT